MGASASHCCSRCCRPVLEQLQGRSALEELADVDGGSGLEPPAPEALPPCALGARQRCPNVATSEQEADGACQDGAELGETWPLPGDTLKLPLPSALTEDGDACCCDDVAVSGTAVGASSVPSPCKSTWPPSVASSPLGSAELCSDTVSPCRLRRSAGGSAASPCLSTWQRSRNSDSCKSATVISKIATPCRVRRVNPASPATSGQQSSDLSGGVSRWESAPRRLAAAAAPAGGRARRRASALRASRRAELLAGLPLAAPGADGSLHVAAHGGSLGFVRLLLGVGVDVDAVDGAHASALHYAAAAGHVHIVDELLDARADHEARDCHAQTPLHYAASAASPAVVRALMECGADPRAVDDSGDTPLSLALQARNHRAALAMVDSAYEQGPAGDREV